MRDQYKLLAEKYQTVTENEASPEQQAAFQAYMAKHNELRRKYKRESEIEINNEIYTVYYTPSYERHVVDHRASIGHYGVRGQDVFADIPQITDYDDVLILRYDDATQDDVEVTDPALVQTLIARVNDELNDERENISYGREM